MDENEKKRLIEFFKRVHNKEIRGEELTASEKLILHTTEMQRIKLAKHGLFLEELSDDWSANVRAEVASNIDTPIDILYKLSFDEDEYVRHFVALNQNATTEILDRLSLDISEKVREAVAKRRIRHSRTTPEIPM